MRRKYPAKVEQINAVPYAKSSPTQLLGDKCARAVCSLLVALQPVLTTYSPALAAEQQRPIFPLYFFSLAKGRNATLHAQTHHTPLSGLIDASPISHHTANV